MTSKGWERVLEHLKNSVSEQVFQTWIRPLRYVAREGSTLFIATPHKFFKQWIEDNHIDQIEEAARKELGEEISIDIVVGGEEEPLPPPVTPPQFLEPAADAPVRPRGTYAALNSRYTFDRFVIGTGNQFAHAASVAVANTPGNSYNPLFIYGGVGLGKTHLLQAIGNEVTKKTDKILYTTSEKFTNNYIQAVTSGKAKEFKNLYRNVDLLLVDDVQFMGGKDGTQEEFFHTFNELLQNDKQIVLTSDRAPKAIPAIEKRLVSRFEAGMVADVGKPDIETKVAILGKKALDKEFPLDRECLLYIAEHVQNNIRELEGALNKVIASHQLKGLTPSLKTIKELLGDYISNIQAKSLAPKEVIEAVAKFYNISYKELISSSRKKELVWPRQIAIYLIREELNTSYPTIGNELGGRDHTTAMHAYNKIYHEVKETGNEKIKQELESIKQLFGNSY